MRDSTACSYKQGYMIPISRSSDPHLKTLLFVNPYMGSYWRRKENHRNRKQAPSGLIKASIVLHSPPLQVGKGHHDTLCIHQKSTDARLAWMLVLTKLHVIEFKSLTFWFTPSFRTPSVLTWQSVDIGKEYAATTSVKAAPDPGSY